MKGKARLFGAKLVIAGAALVLWQGAAQAQSEVRLSDDPSYCEVFNALSNTAAPECDTGVAKGSGSGLSLGGSTQGLAITRTKQAKDAAATGQGATGQANAAPAVPSGPRAAAFGSIRFEFGSHELTARAKEILDTVAAVIKDSRLAEQKFVIEGHTDAVGTAPFNQALSEQRAKSVVTYLISRHAIPAARLNWRGKGESQLSDPANPTSAVNRRVVIVSDVI